MDQSSKQREFELLKAKIEQLEEELQDAKAEENWRPTGFYGTYYATTGALLGIFGAGVALLVNVIGAPAAGKHPLELIRVYLTFPLGDAALQLTEPARQVPLIEDGMVLTFGCCLYLATGMLLGIPYYLALTRLCKGSSLAGRLMVSSVLSIALWLTLYYGVLSWLQPMLFGGNWITDPKVLPVWVGLVTHLIFGWTFAALAPLVRFQPYQQPSTSQN